MKWRFEWLYRGGMVLLVIVAFWSVWANAQSSGTNQAPTVLKPNLPLDGSLANVLSQVDQRYLTFGLDEIPFLRDHAMIFQSV